jgi:hypothetical protein
MTNIWCAFLSEILEVQIQAGMKGVHVGYMHSERVKEMVQYYAKKSSMHACYSHEEMFTGGGLTGYREETVNFCSHTEILSCHTVGIKST